MKWKASPIPRGGDRRTFRRFALLPIRCDDGMYSWLEFVCITQEFLGDWAYASWVTVRIEPCR